VRWYNPKPGLQRPCRAYTDRDSTCSVVQARGTFRAEYGRLRDDGMHTEQAMIFVRHRMWHLKVFAGWVNRRAATSRGRGRMVEPISEVRLLPGRDRPGCLIPTPPGRRASVAAFSARARHEGRHRAGHQEDYLALIRAQTGSLSRKGGAAGRALSLTAPSENRAGERSSGNTSFTCQVNKRHPAFSIVAGVSAALLSDVTKARWSRRPPWYLAKGRIRRASGAPHRKLVGQALSEALSAPAAR